jgi:hypothetical protein
MKTVSVPPHDMWQLSLVFTHNISTCILHNWLLILALRSMSAFCRIISLVPACPGFADWSIQNSKLLFSQKSFSVQMIRYCKVIIYRRLIRPFIYSFILPSSSYTLPTSVITCSQKGLPHSFLFSLSSLHFIFGIWLSFAHYMVHYPIL